jgi:uncharacterized protein
MSLASPARVAPKLLLVVALVLPTLITLAYFVLLSDFPTFWQQTVYGAGKILQFGLPAWWCLVRAGERPRPSGMLPAGSVAGLAFGLAVVVAMHLVYWQVLKPVGFFEEPSTSICGKIRGVGLDTTARYIAAGIFYALVHAALEEYYWRWFVFRHLLGHARPATAVLVSSLGFMAHHVLVLSQFFGWTHWATYVFSLAVAVGGACWAWLYFRAGSLFGVWLSHLLVDAGIFALGYDVARDLFA